MKSTNPVLTRSGAFAPAAAGGYATFDTFDPVEARPGTAAPARREAMTVEDVVVKTASLLAIVVAVGAATWVLSGPGGARGLVGLAAIAGFVLALVNIFKREVSPPLVVAYAVCQGVALGGISKAFEGAYSGIVLQAVVATAAVFGGVLAAYRSGRLRATPRFRRVVMGGLIGLVGLVVVNALVGLFAGGDPLGIRGGNVTLSVLVGLGLIVFGALTFVLDFDEIERLAAQGVAEKESWRAAFGLLVGLVFVYLEVLRLLAILRGDD